MVGVGLARQAEDLLADEDFFGGQASIVTSASSKTSIALGHLLA